MINLNKKKILIIICGGIAAYKSLEIIRILKKNGAIVKAVLTKGAQEFITPLSVSSLSNQKVFTDLFDYKNEAEMDHISLSRWADLILVAPITANKIAKFSYGIADDLASTIVLASNKQVFLAPAMNVRMWEHKANKENLKKLKNYGYFFIGPEIGDMACGEFGEGKMTEPKDIVNFIDKYLQKANKGNKFKALVTAGPTREYIDPVRYITNRSSGKQGYEIAKSLKLSGFQTTLISGPTNLDPIEGVKMVNVCSAKEMFEATIENLPADVAIFSAAVSDWKLKNIKKEKIKKKDKFTISLEENKDIIKHVSNHNSLRPKLVIGFAAETNNLNENSLKKIREKNCDWIIANDVSNKSIGFDSNFNEVTIHYKNNDKEKIYKTKKSLLSDEIVERIISNIN